MHPPPFTSHTECMCVGSNQSADWSTPFNTLSVHHCFQLSISEGITGNCNMLPNPPSQQPVLAASSRPFMIECSRLKEASAVAVMNGEAGGDTTFNVSSNNLQLMPRLALYWSLLQKEKHSSNFAAHTGLNDLWLYWCGHITIPSKMIHSLVYCWQYLSLRQKHLKIQWYHI